MVKTIKIVWTEQSVSDLRNIFAYYKKGSHKVANSLIKNILKRTKVLEKGFIHLGQEEPLLKGRKFVYRYLVLNNYKIIYRIEKNYVYIITVFDTRQNPEELIKTVDK